MLIHLVPDLLSHILLQQEVGLCPDASPAHPDRKQRSKPEQPEQTEQQQAHGSGSSAHAHAQHSSKPASTPAQSKPKQARRDSESALHRPAVTPEHTGQHAVADVKPNATSQLTASKTSQHQISESPGIITFATMGRLNAHSALPPAASAKTGSRDAGKQRGPAEPDVICNSTADVPTRQVALSTESGSHLACSAAPLQTPSPGAGSPDQPASGKRKRITWDPSVVEAGTLPASASTSSSGKSSPDQPASGKRKKIKWDPEAVQPLAQKGSTATSPRKKLPPSNSQLSVPPLRPTKLCADQSASAAPGNMVGASPSSTPPLISVKVLAFDEQSSKQHGQQNQQQQHEQQQQQQQSCQAEDATVSTRAPAWDGVRMTWSWGRGAAVQGHFDAALVSLGSDAAAEPHSGSA